MFLIFDWTKIKIRFQFFLKFIYSEKAILRNLHQLFVLFVRWIISQNFVAFSGYMNFIFKCVRNQNWKMSSNFAHLQKRIIHKLTKMKLRKYNFRSEKLLSTSQKVFCFKTCNNLSLSKLCNLKPDWRKKVFGRTQFICLINLICQNCLKWKKLSTLLYIISILKAKYLMGFRFPSLL